MITIEYNNSQSKNAFEIINDSQHIIQTKEFYNNCSELYNYLYPDHISSSKVILDNISSLFEERHIKTIKDASCGIGHDMYYLLKMGFHVDGSDFCTNMIDYAKSNVLKLFPNSVLSVQDVRNLNKPTSHIQYDGVIFRGNTLSNLQPFELEIVIENLLSQVKKNGFLVIDYRHGEEQFKEKSEFEFRGQGYDKQNGNYYFSYYKFNHSNSIQLPYHVNAFVEVFNPAKHIIPRMYKIEIDSFYVLEQHIVTIIKKLKLNFSFIDIKCRTLPLLKTIIINKN